MWNSQLLGPRCERCVRRDCGGMSRQVGRPALCCELLSSNLSALFPCTAFRSLGEVGLVEFTRGRSVQSFYGVMECLQDAVNMCLVPGSHVVLYALAYTLFVRFVESHSNNDYEEAKAPWERMLDPKSARRMSGFNSGGSFKFITCHSASIRQIGHLPEPTIF
jgi:hypothetical protein